MVDEKSESEELRQEELEKASGAGIPSAQKVEGREQAGEENRQRDAVASDPGPEPDPHKVKPT